MGPYDYNLFRNVKQFVRVECFSLNEVGFSVVKQYFAQLSEIDYRKC